MICGSVFARQIEYGSCLPPSAKYSISPATYNVCWDRRASLFFCFLYTANSRASLFFCIVCLNNSRLAIPRLQASRLNSKIRLSDSGKSFNHKLSVPFDTFTSFRMAVYPIWCLIRSSRAFSLSADFIDSIYQYSLSAYRCYRFNCVNNLYNN